MGFGDWGLGPIPNPQYFNLFNEYETNNLILFISK